MINFTSMATGFQNRGDENRVERRKVAEAFEQFKLNNPEATLTQFQQYIDGMSGGRNYLAGGAGSGEALRKLAADNQAKKARRLAAEAQAAKMARFKNERYIQEQLQDEIGNALISAKPTKPKEGPEGRLSGVQPRINYGKLAREFAENNPLVGEMGFDLSDLFTEQNRNQVLYDYTETNLPKVQTFITGLSNADLENVKPDDITRMFRIDPVIAEAVLKKAKGNLAEETEIKVADLTSRAKTDILQRATSEDIDLADLPEYLESAYGHLPLYEQAFGKTNLDGFINSISAPIERKIAERADAKAKLVSRDKLTAKNSITDGLKVQKDDIIKMLKRMPREQVKQKLLIEMMGRVPDDLRGEFLNATGPGGAYQDNEVMGMVSGQIDNFLDMYAADHEENRQLKQRQVPALATAAASEYVDANIEKGKSTFTQNAAGAVMANGNPAGQFVATQLGGGDGFVMTGSAISTINEVLKEFMVKGNDGKFSIEEGKTIADMVAAARARLTEANAPTVKQALDNQKLLIEAQNVPPPLETFNSYINGLAKGVRETKEATLKGANEIFHSSRSNPALAIKKLQQGLASYRGASNHINGMAAQHSKTSFSWVDPAGGDRYDADQVRQVLGTLDGDVEAAINKMIEEINARALEDARGSSLAPVTATAANQPVAGLVSPPQYSPDGAYTEALTNDPNAQVAVKEFTDVLTQDAGVAVEDLKQMGERRRASDTFGGVDNIKAMVAKAEADGFAPPYSSMADEFEKRNWREAFGRTHDALGKRIPTIGEKFTGGVQDVKGLLGFDKAGNKLAQQQNDLINQARIDSGVTELDKFYLEAAILEPELRTKELLKELYANEKLNIDKPANLREAREVAEIVREIFGNRARLNEAVEGLTREIMAPYQ